MKDWRRERWRRLYIREAVEQTTLWPLMMRGIQAYCIKVADDDGSLTAVRDGEDPVDKAARALNAKSEEWDLACSAINELLEDGFLGFEDGRVFVTNLPAAQVGVSGPEPVARVSRPLKDPAAAARAKAYRERQKAARVTGIVTPPVTVSVTDRHVTEDENRHVSSRDASRLSVTDRHVTPSRGLREEDPSEKLLNTQRDQKREGDQIADARDASHVTSRDASSVTHATTVTSRAVTGTTSPRVRLDPMSRSIMTPNADELWIFQRWAELFGKTGLTFDTKRATCLAERLFGGMSREDAEHALQGALLDDYVMGRKDGIKHDRLTFIFGNQERFEEFRDRGKATGNPAAAAAPRRTIRAWHDPDKPDLAKVGFPDNFEEISQGMLK